MTEPFRDQVRKQVAEGGRALRSAGRVVRDVPALLLLVHFVLFLWLLVFSWSVEPLAILLLLPAALSLAVAVGLHRRSPWLLPAVLSWAGLLILGGLLVLAGHYQISLWPLSLTPFTTGWLLMADGLVFATFSVWAREGVVPEPWIELSLLAGIALVVLLDYGELLATVPAINVVGERVALVQHETLSPEFTPTYSLALLTAPHNLDIDGVLKGPHPHQEDANLGLPDKVDPRSVSGEGVGFFSDPTFLATYSGAFPVDTVINRFNTNLSVFAGTDVSRLQPTHLGPTPTPGSSPNPSEAVREAVLAGYIYPRSPFPRCRGCRHPLSLERRRPATRLFRPRCLRVILQPRPPADGGNPRGARIGCGVLAE